MSDVAANEEFDSILTYLKALSAKLPESDRQRVAEPLTELLRLRRIRDVGPTTGLVERRSWRAS
jgi:hypothetical protein